MVLPGRVRRDAEPFRCRDERSTHLRHPRPCARWVADIDAHWYFAGAVSFKVALLGTIRAT